MSSVAAFIFLIISGYLEIVLWISGTGHLFNAVFILLSFYLFIKWYETKKKFYFAGSLISSLLSITFHELGIVAPLLAFSYLSFKSDGGIKNIIQSFRNKTLSLLFIPTVVYLAVRYFSHTHWFGGDYNYNLLKLPFNFVGNIFGYILITVFGPITYPFYEGIREISRSNIVAAVAFGILVIGFSYVFYRYIFRALSSSEKKITIFSFLFFIILLLPFLGLGNISFRYSYLASFGLIIIAVLLGQKLYEYFKSFGRDVSILLMVTIITVFSLVHFVQAQQAIIDWIGAGEKVERFIISTDSLYQGEWSNENTTFYFADVPVKNNNAWVLPVGIEDALWFAFQNDNLNVISTGSIEEIPGLVFDTKGNWVFQFQSDGSVKKVTKTKSGYQLENE